MEVGFYTRSNKNGCSQSSPMFRVMSMVVPDYDPTFFGAWYIVNNIMT